MAATHLSMKIVPPICPGSKAKKLGEVVEALVEALHLAQLVLIKMHASLPGAPMLYLFVIVPKVKSSGI